MLVAAEKNLAAMEIRGTLASLHLLCMCTLSWLVDGPSLLCMSYWHISAVEDFGYYGSPQASRRKDLRRDLRLVLALFVSFVFPSYRRGVLPLMNEVSYSS